MAGCTYRFGPFRLDAADRVLLRGQDAVQLTPKALDHEVAPFLPVSAVERGESPMAHHQKRKNARCCG